MKKPTEPVPNLGRDTKVYHGIKFLVYAGALLTDAVIGNEANAGLIRDLIRWYILDRLCADHPSADFYAPTDAEIDEAILNLDEEALRRFGVPHHFYIRLLKRQPKTRWVPMEVDDA